MIRINLLRGLRPSAKPPKSLVSRREAVTGLVLLVTAFGMLFYLASRPRSDTARPAPAPTSAPPPPPVKKEQPEAPPPPQPEAKPEAPPEPCRITEVAVQKQGGTVAVMVQSTTALEYKSLELSKPERIAVDVNGCAGNAISQTVEDPVVQRVRSGQPREGVFRLVVDVASMPRYQIRSLERGLEIRILGGKP
jgi:hypothetical protein